MSFMPVSIRSAIRVLSGSERDRSALRSNTGSVEASAAPRMAAAGPERPGGTPRRRRCSTAGTNVPGPMRIRTRRRLDRISARLRVTASVNSTSASARVASARSSGDSNRMSTSPRPRGPSRTPMPRNAATSGTAAPLERTREQRGDDDDDADQRDGGDE